MRPACCVFVSSCCVVVSGESSKRVVRLRLSFVWRCCRVSSNGHMQLGFPWSLKQNASLASLDQRASRPTIIAPHNTLCCCRKEGKGDEDGADSNGQETSPATPAVIPPSRSSWLGPSSRKLQPTEAPVWRAAPHRRRPAAPRKFAKNRPHHWSRPAMVPVSRRQHKYR